MIQYKGYILSLEHCFVVTSLKGSSTAIDISVSSLGHGMVVANGGAGAGDIGKLFLWNNPVGQTGPVWDVQTVRITFASEVVPATRTQLQDVEPQVEVGFYK